MKGVNRFLKELHPLESKIILAFKNKPQLGTPDLISITELPSSNVQRGTQWLLTKGLLKIVKKQKKEFVALTELGKKYTRKGLPEVQIIDLLKEKEEIKVADLTLSLEPRELSGAIGKLKDEGIIDIKKGVLKIKSDAKIKNFMELQKFVSTLGNRIIEMDELSASMQSIIKFRTRKRGAGRDIFRRGEREELTYGLTDLGFSILKMLEKMRPREEISQLTPELIKDGGWRGKKFREYNIELKPPRVVIGRTYPYREFLNGVREKLISMGFCEVTGELVESEFWNMDALFMPQFHPAREIHGVYFVKSPKYAKPIDSKFLNPVSKTHENGWGTGSSGWRYKFNKKQARRLILRSQGTVLSVRTLALHPEPPGKYFAIARCFRPDPVDATHAPDFFQIEGIVVSKDANFRTLLGLLKLFGTEIAQAKEVKFLPGYFPFTEPSVELHGLHPELGWVELGGAGIFRPEVTLPLGVKVPVIAWGLGLDRMAMMILNIHDIRDLFSRDLEFLRKIK